MQFSREIIIRYVLGTVVGTVVACGILQYGQTYSLTHIDPKILFQFIIVYFVSRIVWLMLTGVMLGIIGNLAAIRLGFNDEPYPLILTMTATSVALTSVIISFLQLQLQEAPFFWDYFWGLGLNTSFFVIVITVPFLLSMFFGAFLLRFTRRSRSISEILPPELVTEMRQQKVIR